MILIYVYINVTFFVDAQSRHHETWSSHIEIIMNSFFLCGLQLWTMSLYYILLIYIFIILFLFIYYYIHIILFSIVILMFTNPNCLDAVIHKHKLVNNQPHASQIQYLYFFQVLKLFEHYFFSSFMFSVFTCTKFSYTCIVPRVLTNLVLLSAP